PQSAGRHLPGPTLAALSPSRAAVWSAAVLGSSPVLRQSVLEQRLGSTALPSAPPLRRFASPTGVDPAALAAYRPRRLRRLDAGARAGSQPPGGVAGGPRVSPFGDGHQLSALPHGQHPRARALGDLRRRASGERPRRV